MSQTGQSRLSILPNEEKTDKNLPNTYKLLPKGWNFAKSGYTVTLALEFANVFRVSPKRATTMAGWPLSFTLN